MLVNDVEHLQPPVVGGLIELEVQGPHLVGPFGPEHPGAIVDDIRLDSAGRLTQSPKPESVMGPAIPIFIALWGGRRCLGVGAARG